MIRDQAPATVVIATKDRKDSLRSSLQSIVTQTVPVEVLVLDDGSSDGTSAMVQAEFPRVRLVRSELSLGYIAQRNRGAHLASAPIIFSLDDDATYPSSRTVEQTLHEFSVPHVGAVAIPFVNVNTGPNVLQRAPDASGVFVTDSFVGTAHALRRDLFLELGGYRVEYFHQGEERDLCIRMLAAGAVVRLGAADPIHHFESPLRSFRRMAVFGRRNDILFAWWNVPAPALPLHLAATSVLGLCTGVRTAWPAAMTWGLVRGLVASIRYSRERQPVPLDVYLLARRLRRAGATPLANVVSMLPPLQPR